MRYTLSVGDVVELAYRAEERVRAGELITVSGWRVAVESVVEIRTECLDWLLILGRRHLEHVLRTYTTHYNTERPHRALALVTPEAGNTAARPVNATVERHHLLGGLIHEYRAAALNRVLKPLRRQIRAVLVLRDSARHDPLFGCRRARLL